MNTLYGFHIEIIFRQYLGELTFANGANRGQIGDSVLFGHFAQGAHARLSPLDANIHQIIGEDAAAAAATNCCFANRVVIHIMVIIAGRLDDRPRDFKLTARLVAHTSSTGHIAAVMERQRHMIIFRLVEFQLAVIDGIIGEFANMLGNRIFGIEKIPRSGQAYSGRHSQPARHDHIRQI